MKVKLINAVADSKYAENLLKNRGVEEIDKFINPTIECLQSWKDLDNVTKGISMIFNSLQRKIADVLIVIDCDVDGYSSAAIIYKAIKKLFPDINIEYICHEKKQHGLEDIENRVFFGNYNLVIVPDAGTNDMEICGKYPNVNFLVLDHHDIELHNVGQEPNNMVIVNNQISEKYRNKSLCGAGVVWQFCRALEEHFYDIGVNDMLDLVALATISDMMDVKNLENRYIIKKGLSNINNYFFQTLVAKQEYSLKGGELTPIGVAFYIAPLINAMNRRGSLEEKERMFLAFIEGETLVDCNKRGSKGTKEKVAIESARECVNAKAKQTREQDLMSTIVKNKIANDDLLKHKILIIELGKECDNIPSEINGLSANKIANEYKRPTLIGKVNNQGELKGSIRNIPTIDMPPLKEFLMDSKLFSWVQGHASAAGFCIPKANLAEFHNWADKALKNVDMENDTWEVDFICDSRQEFIKIEEIVFEIDNLKSVWGQFNNEPLINVNNIVLNKNDINLIGSRLDTIKIEKNGITYMFFRCTEETKEKLMMTYDSFELNIVGTMNINDFAGKTTPQIFVKGFEIKEINERDF